MRDPGERPDFLATNGQVTVAGQRQTCTGFVVTARAIRGSGRLNRNGYSTVEKCKPGEPVCQARQMFGLAQRKDFTKPHF